MVDLLSIPRLHVAALYAPVIQSHGSMPLASEALPKTTPDVECRCKLALGRDVSMQHQ